MFVYVIVFVFARSRPRSRASADTVDFRLLTAKNFTLFWLKVQVDAGHFIKPSIEHFFYKKSPYVKFSI